MHTEIEVNGIKGTLYYVCHDVSYLPDYGGYDRVDLCNDKWDLEIRVYWKLYFHAVFCPYGVEYVNEHYDGDITLEIHDTTYQNALQKFVEIVRKDNTKSFHVNTTNINTFTKA